MSNSVRRWPSVTSLLVVPVLALAVAWGSAISSPASAEPSGADDDGSASAEGASESPRQLVSPRSFEEELKEILSWTPYVYESMGRRDPFYPLLSSGGEGYAISDLPDPRSLQLVGVLWGDKDRFALAEDWNGRNFVLREGDPVWSGHVVRIEQSRVVIRYNHFGMWRTIKLHIQTGKERSNGRVR